MGSKCIIKQTLDAWPKHHCSNPYNIQAVLMQNIFIFSLHIQRTKNGNGTSHIPPQHYLLSLWISFISKAQHNAMRNSE